jgi:WXG100 family type VII secretion target
MMMSVLQVNYDELSQIAELFRDDGDDLAQIYSRLMKEMQALQHDWVGEAADAFFAEMEEVLLPALRRTYEAMYLSNDVTRKIVKLIHDADEETGGFFKVDFGADFGAGFFAQAGQGLGSGQPGGDDFGASQFEDAVPPSGAPGTGDDFGASQFGEAVPEQGGGADGGSSKVLTPTEIRKADFEVDEPPESEKDTAAAAASGGGGGSTSSGTPGDLKDLGKGLGAQPVQVSAVGGSEVEIPDHIFESGASAPAGGSESAPAGSGSGSTSSNDSGGAAAGVVGAAGAAAIGAAAKALKDKSEQSG